jgi:hypothetical protein
MTPSQWKKIARLLKEAYKELEQEAVKAGFGVTSPEYEALANKLREAVLKREGFTMEEYEMAANEVKESRQKKDVHHTDTIRTTLGLVIGTDVASATNAMGTVVHGATASTARPTGYAVITWIGSVEPDNSVDNDIWINTA